MPMLKRRYACQRSVIMAPPRERVMMLDDVNIRAVHCRRRLPRWYVTFEWYKTTSLPTLRWQLTMRLKISYVYAMFYRAFHCYALRHCCGAMRRCDDVNYAEAIELLMMPRFSWCWRSGGYSIGARCWVYARASLRWCYAFALIAAARRRWELLLKMTLPTRYAMIYAANITHEWHKTRYAARWVTTTYRWWRRRYRRRFAATLMRRRFTLLPTDNIIFWCLRCWRPDDCFWCR